MFFFKEPATTEISTLSLHTALPIFAGRRGHRRARVVARRHDERRQHVERQRRDRVVRGVPHRVVEPPAQRRLQLLQVARRDRKSTRLNSSHANISYAVFCLKKKKTR